MTRQTRTASQVRSQRISKTKAFDLLKNSGGRFLTTVFVDKKNQNRLMNCRVLKTNSTNPLGYIRVEEMSKVKSGEPSIRNVNLQTLKEIRVNKHIYRVS